MTRTPTDPAVREALLALQATFSRMDGKLKAVIQTSRVPVVGRAPNVEE